MPFVDRLPQVSCQRPLFCGILANTVLSTIPGISGAGPTPEATLLTPVLDAELIVQGAITSRPARPNTPTGCPTPASITRAMMVLTGINPLFINAGLMNRPTVPCLDTGGSPGNDPRSGDAVPAAEVLFRNGAWIGTFLSSYTDLLVLGECVPGGTTTALCVMRALGYPAAVSSSFVENPTAKKEEIAERVLARLRVSGALGPLDVVRMAGDPMMPVAAGIATSYLGTLLLAGGTQMLAVAAVVRALGRDPPAIVTTCYVRDDPTAGICETAAGIGVSISYVDPGFGDISHAGLARYCIGEVKEGMGAGGAMLLAYLLGHTPEAIRGAIITTVASYH